MFIFPSENSFLLLLSYLCLAEQKEICKREYLCTELYSSYCFVIIFDNSVIYCSHRIIISYPVKSITTLNMVLKSNEYKRDTNLILLFDLLTTLSKSTGTLVKLFTKALKLIVFYGHFQCLLKFSYSELYTIFTLFTIILMLLCEISLFTFSTLFVSVSFFFLFYRKSWIVKGSQTLINLS